MRPALVRSAHPPTDDDPVATSLAVSQAAAGAITPVVAPRVGPNAIDDDFVVFGYLQSETQVYHLRWHALTHVGSRFVGFNSAGHLTSTSAFTGRSSYLKSGGAAQAAGVKVVLVLASFSDGSGGTIETVMTSPARRATLVGELVQLLAADEYSHGVSLDLEFSWGPNVRDGITAFTHDLRAGLDSLGPEYELSIYTNAIFSSSQWDFDAATGITPAIDYMLYSMYDWASGNTAQAISDFDNCLGASRMRAYLNDGLPPEKFVPVVSSYSRRWSGTSVYNGFGTSPSSAGFTDALHDVTLNPAIGPSALNYVRADEVGWYGWNNGTARVRTFDGLESMEYKIRHALSAQDPSGTWTGHVYDSLVYEAFGGLDELIRRETHAVTANGWPWIGDVANGRGAAGQTYTMGRYPDGCDTGRNREDFSFAMASPGAPNGDSLTLPATFDFESSFTTGFQTYDVLRRTDPTSAGLPASTNGGRAWRCVGAVGGGVIGAIGDAALGRTQGHSVSGEIFVPSTSAPAQATAVGVCGSQGSNFFSSTAAARTGYESGYWLIHENRAGVQLADGRPDHPRVWELVHATHDNMDGERVTLLASISDATLGTVAGTWTSFEFIVQPYDRAGDRLVVSLAGQEIYRGPLPEDGPRKGAFQVGFRENHSGPPALSEGTWVDGLQFDHVGPVGDPD